MNLRDRRLKFQHGSGRLINQRAVLMLAVTDRFEGVDSWAILTPVQARRLANALNGWADSTNNHIPEGTG